MPDSLGMQGKSEDFIFIRIYINKIPDDMRVNEQKCIREISKQTNYLQNGKKNSQNLEKWRGRLEFKPISEILLWVKHEPLFEVLGASPSKFYKVRLFLVVSMV